MSTYSPEPGVEDEGPFAETMLDSGVLPDAQAHGATTLLVGPAGLPPYMKGPDGDSIADQYVEPYARLLASLIDRRGARLPRHTRVWSR